MNLVGIVVYKTPEYLAWKAMRWRCNPKNKANARYYADRGITVCERWNRFSNFIADMRFMPNEGMELDRQDGTKGYEPGNVKWATRIQQMRNTRANKLVTIGEKTMSLAEWAEVSGIPATTISYRVARNWPQSEILSGIRWKNRVSTR